MPPPPPPLLPVPLPLAGARAGAVDESETEVRIDADTGAGADAAVLSCPRAFEFPHCSWWVVVVLMVMMTMMILTGRNETRPLGRPRCPGPTLLVLTFPFFFPSFGALHLLVSSSPVLLKVRNKRRDG